MPSCLCLHLLVCFFLVKEEDKTKRRDVGVDGQVDCSNSLHEPLPFHFFYLFIPSPFQGGYIKERKEKNGKCRETKLILSIPGGITLFTLFTLTVVRLRLRLGSKYSAFSIIFLQSDFVRMHRKDESSLVLA